MAEPVFRERTEELERASLSSWATLALESKGRDRYEPEDPLRTVFQADRDRILGCDAWMALAGKSAALPARAGRTRLEEALAVVQVTRTIARALRLNEDLSEAVALGQSLGTTPFAAAGEEALALATGVPYRPEEQALRVVEHLADEGSGLNLSWETRDGILHQRWDGPAPATREADAARFARRIVELCRLLDDVEAMGVSDPAVTEVDVLGRRPADRLRTLTADVSRASWDRPQLGFSAMIDRAQARAHGEASARAVASVAAMNATARAVHCVASVTVFTLSGGVEGGADATASAAVDRREGLLPRATPAAVDVVVDGIAAATDSELLARYRAAFEPPG